MAQRLLAGTPSKILATLERCLKMQFLELNLTRCEMVSPPATSPKEIPLAVLRLQQGRRKTRQTSKKSQHWLDTSHIEIIDGSDQIVGTNSKYSSFNK